MKTYALTVKCPLRVGSSAAIANYLAIKDCNISDSLSVRDKKRPVFSCASALKCEADVILATLSDALPMRAAL